MPAGVHAQHSQELGSIPRRKRSALQAGSLAAGPGRAAHWLLQAGVTIVLRGRADGRQGRDSGVGSEAARQGPGSALGLSSQVPAETVGSERGWKGRGGRLRAGWPGVAAVAGERGEGGGVREIEGEPPGRGNPGVGMNRLRPPRVDLLH